MTDSLPALLREAAAAQAERVAVEVHGGARLEYGAWERRSDAQARGLRAAGVRPGDRVALCFDTADWTDYAVSYVAAQKAGAIAVPLPAGMSAIERARILKDCGAALIVAARGSAPASTPSTVDARTLEDAAPGALPAVPARAGDTAEILYVSGRLTAPQALARTHASLLAGPSLGFGAATARSSLAHAFAVGTVAGQDALCACLRPALVRLLVVPVLDVDELCSLLAGGAAGACAVHPAVARALVEGCAHGRHDVSSVAGIVLSGGPVDTALLTDLGVTFPRAALVLSDDTCRHEPGRHPAAADAGKERAEPPDDTAETASVRRLRASAGRGDRIPVAFAQEGMLWQECFAPGSQNLPGLARRYRGALDTTALRRTLEEIIRRHAALRTTFAIRDGRPEQVVRAHRPLDLPLVDLTTLAEREQDEAVARLVEEAGTRPFDLVEGPLFAPTLLRLGDDDHVLVIRAHHAIFDDWSVGVFRRELVALYGAFSAGAGSPLDEPPLQFADFVRSQRRELAGPAGARQLSFWRRELAGAPFVSQLAVDDPRRPQGSRQTAGEPVSVAVPGELAGALRALARHERATLYMTMLAAFGVLVARYNDQDDLLLATVVANRNATELEGLIGCFTKKVPLRLRLGGDLTFREVLARTRRALLGALAHQDLPFEAIVQEVLGPAAAAHGVAPQVAIMFQGVTPRQEVTLPGLRTTGFETSDRATRAHFSAAGTSPRGSDGGPPPWGSGLYLGTFVIISVIESADGLSCAARGAFHGPAVAALMRSYVTLLADVVADPGRRISELSILDAREQDIQLGRGRGPSEHPPACTVGAALADLIRRAPAAIAIGGDAESISRAELDAGCDRLADRLRACGVGRGARVGIALDASPAAVVAALAIAKLGAAWVALNPRDSADRLARIVSDAALSVVVADGERPSLPDGVALVPAGRAPDGDVAIQPAPAAVAQPDDAATIFFGAGRWATDHGVVLDHRCILNLLTGLRAILPAPSSTEPPRRILLCAPWQDGFLRGLAALLDGHRVHAPTPNASAQEIVALLSRDRIDVLDCDAVGLQRLLDAGLREALHERAAGARDLTLLVATRSAAGPELWHALAGLPRTRAHVLYGPPECAFAATAAGDARATARGVGRSLANVAVHVLDAAGRPVPARAVGELHVAGASLARGYLGEPHGAGERFVERVLAGRPTTVLRTGQLARCEPDGSVELLGALDGPQLRGMRIDTESIGSALLRCASIEDVTVALQDGGDAHGRLVARVTAGAPSTLGELRAALWSRLPGYAWPSLTTGVGAHGGADETILRALWAGVLGLGRLAPHENYWQAFSFLDALDQARAAGVAVPTWAVTANRTLETLAVALASERMPRGASSDP